jgi:hypothetical protein
MKVKAIALCACLVGFGAGVASAADLERYKLNDSTKTFSERGHYVTGLDLKNAIDGAAIKDTAEKQTFDVAGIKLDDDYLGAEKKLKALNPKYNYKSNNKTLRGAVERFGYPDDATIISKDGKGKVWYAQRILHMDKDEAIPRKTFLSSVLDKYGQPSNLNGGAFYWLYDREGRQVYPKSNHEKFACSVDFGDTTRAYAPEYISGTCGKAIRVSGIGVEDYVGLYSISIVNYTNVYDESVERKQREIEAKKDNKPKL